MSFLPPQTRRGSGGMALALAVAFILATGCSQQNRKTDRQNPFYRQGLKLQEEQQFVEAAQAFEKCLRHAPESVLTHLQLAMLYEDRLDEPVRALYHYRRYLSKGGSSAPMAQESVTRLQNRLARRWAETHPSLRDSLARQLGLSGRSAPSESGSEGTSGPTARERNLMKSIQQLSRRVRYLQARLREAETGGPAPGDTVRALDGSGSKDPPTRSDPRQGRIYTVKRGDTLTAIARRLYGESALWSKLEEWNKSVIPDHNRLMPGMKLRIPSIDQLRGAATAQPAARPGEE